MIEYPNFKNLDSINVGDIFRVPDIEVRLTHHEVITIQVLASFSGYQRKDTNTGEIQLMVRVLEILDPPYLQDEIIAQIIGCDLWVIKERPYEDQVRELVRMINNLKNPTQVMN